MDDVLAWVTTENQYLLAWIVYLFSATGFSLVFFRLTRKLPFLALRRFIQWSLVVVLYTPVYTNAQENWMVPAFLVGSYEYVLGNIDVAEKAGFSLLIGIVIVLLVVKLEFVLRKLFHLQAD